MINLYKEWKTKDGSYENTQYAQFDTFIEGMFDKARLLDIIKNFICFSGDVKVIGAYHQYFANLFSGVDLKFSIFEPKFLEEISRMKERNIAVEILKKLLAEQVSLYRRTNLVKREDAIATVIGQCEMWADN